MDKFMDSPWFLRFTALFLALILFFSVKAEDEKLVGKAVGDTVDAISNVPVDVYYDNENLVVTGVPETVNITIEGPTNLVQSTKLLKDFTVRADLSNLTLGQHTVRLQTENISEKLHVRIDPATIDVMIEEKITRSFRVDPEINERLLAEDFHIVKMDVTPSTIEVTGAKSIVESISFVKASATGEQGIDQTFEQQARVRVLDRDLNKLNVTIVPEQVNVKVEVAEYNKEVPIVLKKSGAPTSNVTIDSVSTKEGVITLFGPKKVLDQIKELEVDVDLSQVKEQEKTLEVALKKPKGITKMSLDKIKVQVNASQSEEDMEEVVAPEEPKEPEKEEQVATKKFLDVPVRVNGLDEKFKSSFQKPEEGMTDLTVTAEQNMLDKLEKSDFVIYVDASGVTEEGEQNLPISVEGPQNVSWKITDNEAIMHIELA
ncbi:CdaR family protein [Sporosarcina sp. ACRSM]|uniref:CdaR family protein n=1 Tax=Sporosarcina sp. ACRSM TaxID=2918216 RepID=UPI001EF569DB|nr:CdaR family protein [Sporosarcina sp. ACRSM]MCG7336633.1 CdaR family protein [Sporosarcina sp. ACRSM]